jgi:hypothetical protein
VASGEAAGVIAAECEPDDWTYTVETVRRQDVERLKALLALDVKGLVIDWPDDD